MLGDEHGRGHAVLEVGGAHQSEDGHQLLPHEGVVAERVEVGRQRGDQDLGVCRDLHADAGRELVGRAAHRGQVHPAVGPERDAGEPAGLVLVQDPAAESDELRHERVEHRLVHDRGLFGRADHRRVERLRDQQVHDRHPDVRAAVDVERGVARGHADRGLARLVRRADDTGTPRRPRQVDLRVAPQVVRHLVLGVGQDLQRARGKAGRLARRGEQLDDPYGTAGGVGRRPEDDRVARLRGDDRLEQHGRGRVRDGGDRQDHAHGFGHHVDPGVRVVLDDADGLLVAQVVVEELGGHVVLDDLVLEHAEARLLDGQRGELGRCLESRHRHRPHDAVDLLLVEGAERGGGRSRPGHGLIDLVEALGAAGGGHGALAPLLQRW